MHLILNETQNNQTGNELGIKLRLCSMFDLVNDTNSVYREFGTRLGDQIGTPREAKGSEPKGGLAAKQNKARLSRL